MLVWIHYKIVLLQMMLTSRSFSTLLGDGFKYTIQVISPTNFLT